MSQVKRFDHVGITVADLDLVTAFFVGLGLEVEGRTFIDWVRRHRHRYPRLPHRDRHAAAARGRYRAGALELQACRHFSLEQSWAFHQRVGNDAEGAAYAGVAEVAPALPCVGTADASLVGPGSARG